MVVNYTLHQIKNETAREKKYQILNKLIEKFGKVDKDDYEKTYKDMAVGDDTDCILESLYYIFNTNHPRDFTGRSLSVGNVIEFENTTHESNFYYCDLVGFKKIDFLNLEEVN